MELHLGTCGAGSPPCTYYCHGFAHEQSRLFVRFPHHGSLRGLGGFYGPCKDLYASIGKVYVFKDEEPFPVRDVSVYSISENHRHILIHPSRQSPYP